MSPAKWSGAGQQRPSAAGLWGKVLGVAAHRSERAGTVGTGFTHASSSFVLFTEDSRGRRFAKVAPVLS